MGAAIQLNPDRIVEEIRDPNPIFEMVDQTATCVAAGLLAGRIVQVINPTVCVFYALTSLATFKILKQMDEIQTEPQTRAEVVADLMVNSCYWSVSTMAAHIACDAVGFPYLGFRLDVAFLASYVAIEMFKYIASNLIWGVGGAALALADRRA